MKYISSKEASELWNISTRRITYLAEHNRIEGAIRRGRRWFIPSTTEKPVDSRTKVAKESAKKDKYIFPYIIACVHSKDQLNSFTPDEKALYQANSLCEAGKFEESQSQLKELLKTTNNRYIRIGAFNLLALSALWLSDIEGLEKWIVCLKTELYNIDEHKAELDLLLSILNTEIFGTSYLINNKLEDLNNYSPDLIPYISAIICFTETINIAQGKKSANILPYEIICAQAERDGYFYSSMFLHLYISLIYLIKNDPENESRHLKSAIDIAVKHDLLFTLAEMLSFVSIRENNIFNEYPEDIKEKIEHFISINIDAHKELQKVYGKTSVLLRLQEDDYTLLYHCFKGKSISEMATQYGLSESGIKKRLASLYKKFGVNNRKEMFSNYFDTLYYLIKM